MNEESFFVDRAGDIKPLNVTATLISSILGAVFIFGVIGSTYQIIPPAHQGIVISGGKLEDTTKTDGFYFKTPFWTSIYPVYTGANSTDDGANKDQFRGIKPLSKDGQQMEVDLQIEYSISDPVKFRRETGSIESEVIEQLILIPLTRGLVYDYTSDYTWKNLIQSGDRQELRQRVFNTIRTGKVTKRVCTQESKVIDAVTGVETIIESNCTLETTDSIKAVSEFGVTVSAVNLRKVRPNQAIIQAVEDAQKKEQDVLIAKQEAEIARERANREIEIKRGKTESDKLQSEADAYKLRVTLEEKAEGTKAEALAMIEQAKAQKELNNALKGSKDLIEYKRLEVAMKEADALLEWAKHPERRVPTTLTIIGTEEAKSMKLLMGVPNAVME